MGIVMWLNSIFSTSWMYEDSQEMYVFVGNVLPSDEQLHSNFDSVEEDNGQDGSTSSEVGSITKVDNIDEIINQQAGIIYDIEARKVGVFNEGVINWNAFHGGFDHFWK